MASSCPSELTLQTNNRPHHSTGLGDSGEKGESWEKKVWLTLFLYDFSYWENGLLHRPWPAHFLRNWTPWSLFYIRKVESTVRGTFPPCPVRIQTKFFGYQLSFLWLNSLDPPHPFSPTTPKSCSPSQLTPSNMLKTHTHTHTNMHVWTCIHIHGSAHHTCTHTEDTHVPTAHLCTHKHTHTYMLTHIHTHWSAHAHTCIECGYTCTHTQIQACPHSLRHRHNHTLNAHTHVQIYAHRHTHSHVYTHIPTHRWKAQVLPSKDQWKLQLPEWAFPTSLLLLQLLHLQVSPQLLLSPLAPYY